METKRLKAIGEYEIRDTLGKGAMGVVYKVILPDGDQPAALKCFHPGPKLVETMGIDWLRRQFIQEAGIIADIDHPHIVKVRGIEEDAEHLFYLMEYCHHNLGTLIGESYWADSPSRIVRLEQTVAIILQVLSGLMALHGAGIVHRDIKPFNIMLDETGVVKITDFGLSRKRKETSALAPNVLIGTRHYAAPEQVASPEKADQRADLFSVGVMLYRLLTGRLPAEKPQPPTLFNRDLDASWDEMMLTAMAPHPDDRFQQAEIMMNALDHCHLTYRAQKVRECRMAENGVSLAETAPGSLPPGMPARNTMAAIALRSDPQRILAARARAIFNLDDLYRPQTYPPHEFTAIGHGLVTDQGAELMWQQSGSDQPLTWQQAGDYIAELNRAQFGGYQIWRLPTVNELLSLLKPPPPGEDFCLEPVFSAVQKWIWSGDSRSFKASWLVNVVMGFVMSADVLDVYYVKGVCRPPSRL